MVLSGASAKLVFPEMESFVQVMQCAYALIHYSSTLFDVYFVFIIIIFFALFSEKGSDIAVLGSRDPGLASPRGLCAVFFFF